jgi:hypothetical protein
LFVPHPLPTCEAMRCARVGERAEEFEESAVIVCPFPFTILISLSRLTVTFILQSTVDPLPSSTTLDTLCHSFLPIPCSTTADSAGVLLNLETSFPTRLPSASHRRFLPNNVTFASNVLYGPFHIVCLRSPHLSRPHSTISRSSFLVAHHLPAAVLHHLGWG